MRTVCKFLLYAKMTKIANFILTYHVYHHCESRLELWGI
jgi:hypothetical protein